MSGDRERWQNAVESWQVQADAEIQDAARQVANEIAGQLAERMEELARLAPGGFSIEYNGTTWTVWNYNVDDMICEGSTMDSAVSLAVEYFRGRKR